MQYSAKAFTFRRFHTGQVNSPNTFGGPFVIYKIYMDYWSIGLMSFNLWQKAANVTGIYKVYIGSDTAWLGGLPVRLVIITLLACKFRRSLDHQLFN